MKVLSNNKNYINLEHVSVEESAKVITDSIIKTLESAKKDGYKTCALSISLWYDFRF